MRVEHLSVVCSGREGSTVEEERELLDRLGSLLSHSARGEVGAACAFLARSMATDPCALARLGGASTTRMRLLNGGGAFSRVGPAHLLTQAVSGYGLGSVRG